MGRVPAGQRRAAQTFFSKLHCMVQVNGGAGENWPRSGLEAMAAGVPVVVQNQWGWQMIIHGQTGYLCDTDEELCYYTAKLAHEEEHRLEMVGRARQRVTQTGQSRGAVAGVAGRFPTVGMPG